MKLLCLALLACAAFAQKPETVMVTCYAKSGSEADLARVIARHWTTVRDLKLATDAGHLTLRGVEPAAAPTLSRSSPGAMLRFQTTRRCRYRRSGRR